MIEVIRRTAFYQRLTATSTEEPENITDLLDDVRSAIQNHKAIQQHPATPNRALTEAIDSLYQSEQPVEEIIEIIGARCDEMRDRLLKLEQDKSLSKDNLNALKMQEAEQIEAYQIAVIQNDEDAVGLWSQVAETQRQVDAERVKLEAFDVGIAELEDTINTYAEVHKTLLARYRMDRMKQYHDKFVRTVGADLIEALTLYQQEVESLERPNDKTLLSDDVIDYMKARLSMTFTTEANTEELH